MIDDDLGVSELAITSVPGLAGFWRRCAMAKSAVCSRSKHLAWLVTIGTGIT